MLAYVYDDPSAGPSARGRRVSAPPTPEEIRQAIDRPTQTFRRPEAFGAIPIGPDEALRMGLPKDPPWIGFFERKPVPPSRGEASRTLAALVHRGGAPVAGARVRIGHAVGAMRELFPLDTRLTDARGRCKFPLAPTTPIVALAEIAGGTSQLVDVYDELVELELVTPGVFAGTVQKAGVPCRGSISLAPLAGGMHRVERSDGNGRYRIDGVVPGTYDVRIESIDPYTRMTAGTPTYDQIVIGAGETAQRDYDLVAGVTVHVTVAIENVHHAGHVFLLAGATAPPTLPALYELYNALDARLRRTANSLTSTDTEMTTSFLDVQPGTYTVCTSPWGRYGDSHPAQPVASATIVVGEQPVFVQLVLPPLRR